jgi:hypothetical protein
MNHRDRDDIRLEAQVEGSPAYQYGRPRKANLHQTAVLLNPDDISICEVRSGPDGELFKMRWIPCLCVGKYRRETNGDR